MATAPAALAAFHDYEPEPEDFEAAVLAGLARPQKTLPCKFFYDEAGSVLFDSICDLDEYYPTRTETALLQARAADIAALAGPRCHLVEFGSGSSVKIRILLDALEVPEAYTGIDISREHLLKSTAALATEYPSLEVHAICADYTRPFDLSPPRRYPQARPVGFFPGSTIGNFTIDRAQDFLRRVADMLRPMGGDLLIGVDLQKDLSVLLPAYNDAKGVTAAFNRNILVRANRELGADFNLDAFEHTARYNPEFNRVEMHLVSTRDQEVTIGGQRIAFAAGETVHTENSHKYTVEGFRRMAHEAGFTPTAVWRDPDNLFSIHYLKTA